MNPEAINNLFIFALIAGLVLIGAEVFVPGGVLGVLGGIALLVAIGTAFAAFPPQLATYVTIGILILIGVVVYLWIRYFPHTPLGKRMTLGRHLKSSAETGAPQDRALGHTRLADTDLRPSGFAIIDGERLDVITEGEMIDKGTPLQVVEVHGNRIVVAESPSPTESSTTTEPTTTTTIEQEANPGGTTP